MDGGSHARVGLMAAQARLGLLNRESCAQM